MSAFVDFGRKTQYSVKNAMGDTKTALPILKEHDQKWFAVSDYGECSGWVNQHFTCMKNGIVPILGMETFVNDYRFADGENGKAVVRKLGEDEEWERKDSEVQDDELDWSQIDFPLDLFARTMDGYYNIIRIHNDAQINGVARRPRVSDAFLKSHGKGIVALMPTPYSEVSSRIYNGEFQEAKRKYEFYKSVFDDVYVEIPVIEDEDYRSINSDIIRFCMRNGIQMVPVINAHYDSADDEEAFQIFRRCGDIRGGMSYEVDYAPHMHMKTSEEVWETFRRYHQSDVFTEDVMKSLMANLGMLCMSFKALDLDTSPKTPHFENSEEKLREHAWNGFRKCGFDKMGDVYKERLEYELKNIVGAGFADYFLLIEQMFDWHVNTMHRLSSVGRGSAASSLVLRCLGVTKVDPIRHNLPFQRFLSLDRLLEKLANGGKLTGSDFPDVDSDFQSNAKDGVKEFFAETYGSENICSVGSIGYLHVKSTLKELGRAFGIDDKEINELTTVGMQDFGKDEEEGGVPDDALPLDDLCAKFPALGDFLTKYPHVSSVFKKLQGTINNWGVHAGGILISDKSLLDQLPLRLSKDGRLVSCWSEGLNGRELGEMGFLKLDLLAIETLDIIEEAIQMINERHPNANVTFDEVMRLMINNEDPHALARIEKGMNEGVFQFETALALRVVKEMHGMRQFDDIASLSTLMRPAALQNGFGKKYGERRDGLESYTVPDCMKPYIGNEMGLPIFQEHALFYGYYMAGMNMVDSYDFCKKLYKNKLTTKEDIEKWHGKFISGCLRKIRHKEYDVEFDDGSKKTYTEYDQIKCGDGDFHTIPEILAGGLDISGD